MTKSLQGYMQQIPGPFEYETVAVSQTGQVLGVTGAAGDYLDGLVINTITPLTSGVTLLDGATSIVIQTGATTNVTGVQFIKFHCVSVNGAWSVTTGAGATAIGIGKFT